MGRTLRTVLLAVAVAGTGCHGTDRSEPRVADLDAFCDTWAAIDGRDASTTQVRTLLAAAPDDVSADVGTYVAALRSDATDATDRPVADARAAITAFVTDHC
jgi:hypothetical protein